MIPRLAVVNSSPMTLNLERTAGAAPSASSLPLPWFFPLTVYYHLVHSSPSAICWSALLVSEAVLKKLALVSPKRPILRFFDNNSETWEHMLKTLYRNMGNVDTHISHVLMCEMIADAIAKIVMW